VLKTLKLIHVAIAIITIALKILKLHNLDYIPNSKFNCTISSIKNLNKYQTSAESASHVILTYQYIISSLTIESEFEPTQKQYAKYNKLMENDN